MNYSPISGKDRMITIDIIRGFALFGIFLVNMPSFHSPVFMKSVYGQEVNDTGIDYWIDVFFTLFVEMKFFTIFSFLFGLGFYIFMSRAEEKGLGLKRLYLRRIFALFLFGVVHLVALWFGDVLHTYAIGGVILLLFYKRKIKTLIIWAFSLIILINVLFSLVLFVPEDGLMEQTNTIGVHGSFAEYVDVYENAGYGEWVSYRMATEMPRVLNNLLPGLIPVMAMFLFGLAAGKAEIFLDIAKHSPFLKKIRLVTFLISIPLVCLLAVFKLEFINLGLKQMYVVQLFKSLTGTSLCFFYVSTLTLLLRKEKWQKRLRPLGYNGQMALTNYLSQTIISIGLFVGLGLYGDISLATGTLVCLVVFALQIAFSTFWLKRYRFGPFEWLWRSFTYRKFQPMNKKATEQKNLFS